ncbi:MAG: glycoside hydrolase family 2 TIM barrel-domain containing protein [Candidatus Neomarinimicrobiota bacterium]
MFRITTRTMIVVGVFLFWSSCASEDSKPVRSLQRINNSWRFHKGEVNAGYQADLNDRRWERVNLPHTWNVDDPFDRRGIEDGYDISPGYYRGSGWYRKAVNIPKSNAGKRLYLVFEGANKVTDVWVNEFYVGEHIGGYSGFSFDITPYIAFGKRNLIAVRVNNAYHYDIPPQSADYTMYGGIYRDLYLLETTTVHIEWVHVQTPEVSPERAHVTVTTPVINTSKESFDGQLETVIQDPQKRIVLTRSVDVSIPPDSTAEIQLDLEISAPITLWSPEAPHLYAVQVRLSRDQVTLDEITGNFGLRWFSFDPDQGFYLNGEYLRLKGVNRHQDRAGYGNAVPNELHIEDMRLIKSMGANFVRLAHYPQDPAVLDACDSLGLLVWEEIPVVRSVGREAFIANAKQMMREMITQHLNHPSIIIWGVMNEVIRDQPDEELHWSVDLCQALVQLAHNLDPSRYTAQAQFKDRGTDIMGITEISGWNCYYGWYSGTFDDFGDVMDERKQAYPEQVFIISEYGAGSKRGYHVEDSKAPDFSENWQLAFHKRYWEQIVQRPYIAGSCVWNMFDFGSYEKGGNIPHINQKGLADFARVPKDVFYFYQSIWTEEPMIYIVSHTWLQRAGVEGEAKQIEVFSNCDSVELLINGESLGTRPQPFIWRATLKKGTNHLRAIGRKEQTVVEDKITIRYSLSD